ncbi:MAG: hypothetical protein AAF939_17300 [Planctomycetota bacterium]
MVQREIESRGIATVSPSVALDVTQHALPPRAMFLPFMMGHLFGVPFHIELQRRILMELLEMGLKCGESGEIRMFDYTWAQARKEGKRLSRED